MADSETGWLETEEEDPRTEELRDQLRRAPKPTEAQGYRVEEAALWLHRYVPPGSVITYIADDPSLVPAGTIAALVTKYLSDASGLWLEVAVLGCSESGFKSKLKPLYRGQRKHHHVCYPDAEGCCPLVGEPGVHLRHFHWFPPGKFDEEWMTNAARKEVQRGLDIFRVYQSAEEHRAGERERKGMSDTERRLDRLRAKRPGHVRFSDPMESRLSAAPEGPTPSGPRPGALRRSPTSPSAPAIADQSRLQVKSEVIDLVAPDLKKESVKKKKKSKKGKGVADVLAKAVAARQTWESNSTSSRRKRSRSSSHHRSRSSKRRRRRSSSQESSREDSSDSSSHSLQPPLKKKSDKDPGSVFKMLLNQAADQLAQEGLETDEMRSNLSSSHKVKLYTFYQLAIKPSLDVRSRDNKEIALLAKALDLLQEGDLPRLADLLAARMIAVETATKQGWQAAKFLELQSLDDDGTAPPHILLAAQRHSKQVEKAGGKGSWSRSGNWGQDWGADSRPKGRGKGPKGKGNKGKGKTKGGKGAWGPWNAADKDKAVDKAAKPDG